MFSVPLRARIAAHLPAPAAIVTFLGLVAALITAFGHLTPAEAVALSSLATAIGTVVTCLAQRPVHMLVLTAAAGTVVGDLWLFGARLDAAEQAAVVAFAGFAIGSVLHLIGTPVVDTRTVQPEFVFTSHTHPPESMTG